VHYNSLNAEIEGLMKPRVISYIRFSSKRQADGRSEERQGDSAQKWCEANGHVLDENLADLGVSAFRGRQRTKGGLAAFLQNVENGKIPAGSYLLVEHFDRLSREEVSDAQDLVKSILKKGVIIVTLLDGAQYTKESLNNLGALFMMIMMFSRAHDESKVKGERVTATFSRKRAEGLRPFGSAPGWLQRKENGKDGEWEVIPELADIVVKVFEHAANGMGGPSIAKLANAEGWPIPTRRTAWSTENWHSKMPAIILKNRAVLGEAEHWLRSKKAMEQAQVDVPFKSGKVIKDYYPRIISDDQWYRARAAVASRKTLPPRRDEHYLNIFSGLLRCGHCGASVQRKAVRLLAELTLSV
jgi:DNA invertase Pin-like site-specific DNA recombinase